MKRHYFDVKASHLDLINTLHPEGEIDPSVGAPQRAVIEATRNELKAYFEGLGVDPYNIPTPDTIEVQDLKCGDRIYQAGRILTVKRTYVMPDRVVGRYGLAMLPVDKDLVGLYRVVVTGYADTRESIVLRQYYPAGYKFETPPASV